MAIEIKTSQKRTSWHAILFIVSCLLLLFFFITYFVFASNTERTEQEIKALEESVQEDKVLQRELSNVEQKINQVKAILTREGIIKVENGEASFSELKVDKIFKFLAENVHPNVWFYSLNFDDESQKASIRGEAGNMRSFKEQLIVLENELKNKFHLTGYSIKDNQKVDFTFDLKVDAQILL